MALSAPIDHSAARTLLQDALTQLDTRGSRFVRRAEVEARDRIERAIEKLDEGSYGECDDCGRGIAGARLDAAPDSLLCVACEGRASRRVTAARH